MSRHSQLNRPGIGLFSRRRHNWSFTRHRCNDLGKIGIPDRVLFKPAKLDNGVEVMVPQFVKTGDMIRLDLETLKYMDRVRRTTPGTVGSS